MPKSCTSLNFERFLTHSLLHSFCHFENNCDEVFLLRKEKLYLFTKEKMKKISIYNHQAQKMRIYFFNLFFHMEKNIANWIPWRKFFSYTLVQRYIVPSASDWGYIRRIFSSNQIIQKISFSLWFWPSDLLFDRF